MFKLLYIAANNRLVVLPDGPSYSPWYGHKTTRQETGDIGVLLHIRFSAVLVVCLVYHC